MPEVDYLTTSTAKPHSMPALVSLATGSLAAVVGGVVLLAWAFDVDVLKRPLPGGVTMKANTALSIVLAGVAVATTTSRGVPTRIGGILALAVATATVATMLEYVLGRDLGIDQLLVADTDPNSSAPGRMAPMTAICLAAVGIGVWVSRPSGALALREPLALVAPLGSGVATLGYTFDTRALYTVGPYTSMAPHRTSRHCVWQSW